MNRAAKSFLVSITIALAATLLAAPWVCRASDSAEAALFARSIVSAGDTARLHRAFAKARRAEPVTVAVIGGSITQGARASKPERCYGNLVADWWRTTFPEAKIAFVNTGIGATGSNYGALRAKRDLLSRNPDFIVVEYAVNDAGAPKGHAEPLEGLVRQILGQPNQPAVMLLFTMNKDGSNVQEWHGRVGRHYDLPMISFRDALWPEIRAGRIQWRDIEADEVHPNDRGHDYLARFVTRFLETALRDGPKDQQRIGPLPKPLFSDLFEHVALFEGDRLKPLTNQGWTFDAKARGFTADQPGSVIEFELEGQAVLVTDWHIRGPFGKARMQVDNLPPVVRDAWFDQTWGGYRDTSLLARDLKSGKHRVRIELLEDKNPQSDGHQFRLMALGAAGVAEQVK
jgi:lysophospholipase L1-like esterase